MARLHWPWPDFVLTRIEREHLCHDHSSLNGGGCGKFDNGSRHLGGIRSYGFTYLKCLPFLPLSLLGHRKYTGVAGEQ